jgi:hypothetical protein
VVRSISWDDVFGCPDTESLDGWGDDGPDWQAWEETYGQYPKQSHCTRIIRICGYHSSCALAEPDAGIVNFYQTKDTLMGHVDRSEICATSPLVSISLASTFPALPSRLLIFIPLLVSETPQSSLSVVSRVTLPQSRSCCVLVTSLSCPDLLAVVHTTVFHAYSRERYRLILGRVPISMTVCGRRMHGTWTRRESTLTCGKYFPRGSTLAPHKIRTVAEPYRLVRL